MVEPVESLILGEAVRTLDDRFRVSLPTEMVEQLGHDSSEHILCKERPGCLSLWEAGNWTKKVEAGVELVQSKIRAGRLEGRVEQVQLLGRLLSTRHKTIQLAGRGRLVIPDGFREFLGVEPGDKIMFVGAAVCVEIWHPDRWATHIGEQMPEFHKLFDQLTA